MANIIPVRAICVEGDVAFVPLTKGYEAVIDAADVPFVEGFNWHAKVDTRAVYAARKVRLASGKQATLRLHRVILDAPDGMEVDHINCDGLDNRRLNLRLATKAQNQHNQRLSCANTSGLKGVTWNKRGEKWQAQIMLNGQVK